MPAKTRAERIQEQVTRWLDKLGKTPDIRASLKDEMIRRPVKRCPTCEGKCVLRQPDGQENMCPTCRGFGYVPMTLKEIKQDYRTIRSHVQSRYGLSSKKFDARAARLLKDVPEPSPGHWLHAAHQIAKSPTNDRSPK